MNIFQRVLLYVLFVGLLDAKDYVVGNLMGQLGNQMFIVAATTSLALDNGAVAVFPDLQTKQEWNIPYNREKVFLKVNSEIPKKNINYHYQEPAFEFNAIKYQRNMSITGYFQSEKYFKNNKQAIINLFKPHKETLRQLRKNFGWILDHPKTVSIHFRDYTPDDPLLETYYMCDLSYYKKAVSLFPKDSLFVVFSNNIQWCKEQFLELDVDLFFVEGQPHEQDLYLMSFCKDHIISNSSFSWWGAYLNQSPIKKVVAPLNWFKESYSKNTADLIPEDWIRI